MRLACEAYLVKNRLNVVRRVRPADHETIVVLPVRVYLVERLTDARIEVIDDVQSGVLYS